jgi:hypothetical protein
MSRTNCKACGAEIDMAYLIGTNDRIALEVAPETAGHADRYRVVSANPLVVEQVPKDAVGSFHADHAWDCPAGNNARL